MFKNYFKIAWRNLVKNKGYSAINIGGLAIGMAVAILIGLWIYDELSFDKYHKNYDRIAQVMQQQTNNGQVYTMGSVPFPLGDELKSRHGSDFKYIVMSSSEGSHILSSGEQKISQRGAYMDVDAAKMLTLKMLKGTYDGLKDPASVLLSVSAARAIFGDADPIDKTIKIDNKQEVKVTGVYEDLPDNTQFKKLKFIAPWQLYVSSEEWVKNSMAKWGNNSFQAFAQIADNADFTSVNKRIINAKLKRVPAEDKKYNSLIFLHPMEDWHLKSHWENGVHTGGLIDYVRLFLMVGIFVLLLACINFMNLSTARSEKRAKEVGIRKAIGSLRSQLIGQFFSESFMVVAFAFLLSLLIVQLMLPWFNEVAGKKMAILWFNPIFWLMGVGFALFTGIIAGIYPALYLSSFKPIKVLKGTFRVGRFAAIPRKALVIVQFTVSIILIIGTMIVYRQIQFSKDRPLGYDREALMMIEMKSPDFEGKTDLLRHELVSNGAITEIAESSSPVTAVLSNNGGISWPGKNPSLDGGFATIWVSKDFGKTISWQFAAGRDFSKDLPTDSAAVVINEAAVKFMGVKDPIGTVLKWGNDEHAKNYTVIGVIKDMVMSSPYEPVKQTIYFANHPEYADWINLRLNRDKSIHESVVKIEAAFKKYVPAAPFDYKFADDEYARKFLTEERIGKLAAFFASLAILISCLGLFGFASFVAEQKTKEIGVRKVLGASVANVWRLLSKDFVVLVFISLVVAIPIAYYFMHNWLQDYQYRTDLSWWIFAAAGAVALVITLLTVSFQAIKAAIANPVKSLRTE